MIISIKLSSDKKKRKSIENFLNKTFKHSHFLKLMYFAALLKVSVGQSFIKYFKKFNY